MTAPPLSRAALVAAACLAAGPAAAGIVDVEGPVETALRRRCRLPASPWPR